MEVHIIANTINMWTENKREKKEGSNLQEN